MAIPVDGRQENGLYLVVPQLIGGEVGGDQDLQGRGWRGWGKPASWGEAKGWAWTQQQRGSARRGPSLAGRTAPRSPHTRWDCAPQPYLSGSQGHFAVLALAQLGELIEDGGQLLRQGRVWATELILWGTKQNLSGFCPPAANMPALILCQGCGCPRQTGQLLGSLAPGM